MNGRANGRTCDIAIAGGGLAGGLIALALRRARPDLTVHLYEAGPALGGNHRWSWFAPDLPPGGEALLAPLRITTWENGYTVRFPRHHRHLETPYRSLGSVDFDACLRRELAQESVHTGRRVAALEAGAVHFLDGGQARARVVIDCRDGAYMGHLQGGWQVFMGRHLRTHEPHRVSAPVIMDATVDQLGGFRFVYVLPLGAHDLLVEDTYYQDSPVLDRGALSGRIDAYCRQFRWDGEILGFETGVLPVITGGNFAAYQAANRVAGVAMAGSRGGFVHPLTSYTLPFAVGTALAIARDADLPGDQLAARLEAMARSHWRATGYYRLLGTMLFGAARPDRRVRVFERFYTLSQGLVERFYAGRSTLADKARILAGKPPVPIHQALGALASRRPALNPDSESEPA